MILYLQASNIGQIQLRLPNFDCNVILLCRVIKCMGQHARVHGISTSNHTVFKGGMISESEQ
jgi:hypothetical protein